MASSAAKSQNTFRSTHKEFLLFMSIPLAIILIVAAVVVVPRFFAKPKYDFIYSSCPSYLCDFDVSVNSAGKITEAPSQSGFGQTQPEIYYYDVSHNSAKRIDLTSAEAYKLDSASVSPDGYRLQQNTSGGGFLFWDSGGDYSWYLKNGLKQKQLHIGTGSYYSSNDITFIGWVTR